MRTHGQTTKLVVFSESCRTSLASHCSRKATRKLPCPCAPFDTVCSYQILTTGPFFRAAIFFQNTGHVYSRPINYTLLPNHRVPCIIAICIRCSIITVPRLFREKWLRDYLVDAITKLFNKWRSLEQWFPTWGTHYPPRVRSRTFRGYGKKNWIIAEKSTPTYRVIKNSLCTLRLR